MILITNIQYFTLRKILCLCLMKCSSETLQNLLYFWNISLCTKAKNWIYLNTGCLILGQSNFWKKCFLLQASSVLWGVYPLVEICPETQWVCARWKVPAKQFKIWHILCIWKPKVSFSVFHFVLLFIFSKWMPRSMST